MNDIEAFLVRNNIPLVGVYPFEDKRGRVVKATVLDEKSHSFPEDEFTDYSSKLSEEIFKEKLEKV